MQKVFVFQQIYSLLVLWPPFVFLFKNTDKSIFIIHNTILVYLCRTKVKKEE